MVLGQAQKRIAKVRKCKQHSVFFLQRTVEGEERGSEATAETEKIANTSAGIEPGTLSKRSWCSSTELSRQATLPACLFDNLIRSAWCCEVDAERVKLAGDVARLGSLVVEHQPHLLRVPGSIPAEVFAIFSVSAKLSVNSNFHFSFPFPSPFDLSLKKSHFFAFNQLNVELNRKIRLGLPPPPPPPKKKALSACTCSHEAAASNHVENETGSRSVCSWTDQTFNNRIRSSCLKIELCTWKSE